MYRRVLYDYSLMSDEKCLQRPNDATQVAFVLVMVIQVLCIENIVKSDHVLVFGRHTGTNSSQF